MGADPLRTVVGHFRVALDLVMKAKLSAMSLLRKIISFHSYANKTNFHMKSFALSLAFIMRLSNSEIAYLAEAAKVVL